MVHLEELQQGTIIYNNRTSLGLFCLEFLRISGEKIIFLNEDKKEITLSKKQLEMFSLTKDEANIEAYRNELENINAEIHMLERELQRYNNKIKKLDDQYSYLKEKYPEEFI